MVNSGIKMLLLAGVLCLRSAQGGPLKYTKNYCATSVCKLCKKARKQKEKQASVKDNGRVDEAVDVALNVAQSARCTV